MLRTVRWNLKYHVKRRTKKRSGGRRGLPVLVVVMALLLAGLVWLAKERGALQSWRKFFTKTEPAKTPAPSRPAVASPRPQRPPAPAPAPSPTPNPSLPLPRQTVISSNPPPPRPLPLLDAQIALDRLGISGGSIDGRMGSQTRAALRAFQRREGLVETGALDAPTRTRIPQPTAPLTTYRVTPTDLERLLPLAPTWRGKQAQPRLDYESILELVAERHHAHPDLLRRLNPKVNWTDVPPETLLTVPAIERERPPKKAAYLRIRLGERTLEALDAADHLLAHFPCSIARRVEKRPSGELRVAVAIPDPNYTFNPEIFPESAEAKEIGRKLVLAPGPNNPVGTTWIGLDKPSYGIHGTPRPEDVGRTESHGCFRLANWNAEYLLPMISVGTPVRVEP